MVERKRPFPHPLDVECPTCKAEVDEWCRTPNGAMSVLHAARLVRYKDDYRAPLESVVCPTCGRS